MKQGDKIGDDRIAFIWDDSPIPIDDTEEIDPMAELDELNLHLIFPSEEEYYEYLKKRDKEDNQH